MKYEEIPLFFKPTVRLEIQKLRKEMLSERGKFPHLIAARVVTTKTILSSPEEMMNSPVLSSKDADTLQVNAKGLINKIKGAAWYELERGSFFVQHSWPQVCQEFVPS